MSLVPRWYNRLPSRLGREGTDFFNLSKFFEDLDEDLSQWMTHPSGLTVSSDDKNIYVEAYVPGLTPKEVDVSLDDEGILWIKGEKKQEEKDKGKKFYRKAVSSFSYCIPLGNEVEKDVEPQAICKDGVMKITFPKKREKQKVAKKIAVKEEK